MKCEGKEQRRVALALVSHMMGKLLGKFVNKFANLLVSQHRNTARKRFG